MLHFGDDMRFQQVLDALEDRTEMRMPVVDRKSLLSEQVGAARSKTDTAAEQPHQIGGDGHFLRRHVRGDVRILSDGQVVTDESERDFICRSRGCSRTSDGRRRRKIRQ